MPVTLFDDVWRFRTDEGWERLSVSGSHPSARSYHAAAAILRESAGMIMFGGANCTGACICYHDLWVFDLEKHHWRLVNTMGDIDSRYHHTLTVHDGIAYTFGGESYSPRYMYHNSVSSIDVNSDGTMIVVYALVMIGAVCLLAYAWQSRRRRKSNDHHIQ